MLKYFIFLCTSLYLKATCFRRLSALPRPSAGRSSARPATSSQPPARRQPRRSPGSATSRNPTSLLLCSRQSRPASPNPPAPGGSSAGESTSGWGTAWGSPAAKKTLVETTLRPRRGRAQPSCSSRCRCCSARRGAFLSTRTRNRSFLPRPPVVVGNRTLCGI